MTIKNSTLKTEKQISPNEKNYECVNCGWIGPHYKMVDDWIWINNEEQLHSTFICPACKAFYESIDDYNYVGILTIK